MTDDVKAGSTKSLTYQSTQLIEAPKPSQPPSIDTQTSSSFLKTLSQYFSINSVSSWGLSEVFKSFQGYATIRGTYEWVINPQVLKYRRLMQILKTDDPETRRQNEAYDAYNDRLQRIVELNGILKNAGINREVLYSGRWENPDLLSPKEHQVIYGQKKS